MKMRTNDVLCNLKNYENWDMRAYQLERPEAMECIRLCEFAQANQRAYDVFCLRLDEEEEDDI